MEGFQRAYPNDTETAGGSPFSPTVRWSQMRSRPFWLQSVDVILFRFPLMVPRPLLMTRSGVREPLSELCRVHATC